MELKKYKIQQMLKREEMTKAVKRKKKKLESMRRSMSKQMLAEF
jgi:hypothetical protein